ncbi:MAG: hypothetical protein H6983_16665 [Ectothiorhodospiraceae bacterium]|nr:hypothetical protein [Ectothiorhodospiraceae bacterium]
MQVILATDTLDLDREEVTSLARRYRDLAVSRYAGAIDDLTATIVHERRPGLPARFRCDLDARLRRRLSVRVSASDRDLETSVARAFARAARTIGQRVGRGLRSSLRPRPEPTPA